MFIGEIQNNGKDIIHFEKKILRSEIIDNNIKGFGKYSRMISGKVHNKLSNKILKYLKYLY
jgi:hypothetical protein